MHTPQSPSLLESTVLLFRNPDIYDNIFHQAIYGNFSLKILPLHFFHVSDLISYIFIKNTDLPSKISLSITKLSLTLPLHILETHTLSIFIMWNPDSLKTLQLLSFPQKVFMLWEISHSLHI
jgi:hypothetical protein